jgi:hypothetical protein
MAIKTVAELPMTEKKPFMLHAQGMRPSRLPVNAFNPEGKKTPMGMASGAMSRLHESILNGNGKPDRTF